MVMNQRDWMKVFRALNQKHYKKFVDEKVTFLINKTFKEKCYKWYLSYTYEKNCKKIKYVDGNPGL
jgi:hypothetical protein